MAASRSCSRHRRFLAAFLAFTLPVLNGCNVLQGIRASEPPLQVGHTERFLLEGTETCTSVDVDWGDGSVENGVIPLPGNRIELDTSFIETRTLVHTYAGWGGGKTVTVTGNGCEGTIRGRFQSSPASKSIGWAQPAPPGTVGVCQAAVGLPPLIPRMLVKVSITTVARFRDINFGCPLAGCVYDADGKPGSVAASPFPFPGLKEYSVLFRVGSQVVQGGSQTQFTTTAGGPLMFCLNDGDNDLTNNNGGFDVTISADQLGPPLP